MKEIFPFRPPRVLDDEIGVWPDGQDRLATVVIGPGCAVPNALIVSPQGKFFGTVFGLVQNCCVDAAHKKCVRTAERPQLIRAEPPAGDRIRCPSILY